jgi:N-acetylglucosamine-6-phosphate deacetylase
MKYVEANRLLENGHICAVKIGMRCGRITSLTDYPEAGASLPLAVPGFIDIHVHGGGGADAMDATADAFATIANMHARHGTTGLLLTTVTQTPEQIDSVLRAAQGFVGTDGDTRSGQVEPVGAQVLGVHLEGPFIHPDRPGAQRSDLILDPDVGLAKSWFDTGVVKMITLAPERPGAHAVARSAADRGIVVSAGHTDATADDLELAKAAGFSHVTHLCNAMRPLLHRDVGPIGCVVSDDEFTADLICDGVHLAPAMLQTLLRSVGVERLMLISDAIRAAGLGPGTYDLGGLDVNVENGACRLADGTLAGSVLTMSRAFQLVQELGEVSLAAASQLTATNPARRLGFARKGNIAENYDADIVLLSPDSEVLATIVQGRTVYER